MDRQNHQILTTRPRANGGYRATILGRAFTNVLSCRMEHVRPDALSCRCADVRRYRRPIPYQPHRDGFTSIAPRQSWSGWPWLWGGRVPAPARCLRERPRTTGSPAPRHPLLSRWPPGAVSEWPAVTCTCWWQISGTGRRWRIGRRCPTPSWSLRRPPSWASRGWCSCWTRRLRGRGRYSGIRSSGIVRRRSGDGCCSTAG